MYIQATLINARCDEQALTETFITEQRPTDGPSVSVDSEGFNNYSFTKHVDDDEDALDVFCLALFSGSRTPERIAEIRSQVKALLAN